MLFWLTSVTRSQSASWVATMPPVRAIPTLLTRTSIRPNAAMHASTMALTLSALATSAAWVAHTPPSPSMISLVSFAASGSRSIPNTLAPSRANSTAVALPLPQPGPIEPAPVISATLSLRHSPIPLPPRQPAGRACPIAVDAAKLTETARQGGSDPSAGRAAPMPPADLNSALLRRQQVAQSGLEYLAVVVLGQRVDEAVVLGPLEAGDMGKAVGIEIGGSALRAGRCHDECDHCLAPPGVRLADHRHLGDRRVAQQHLLDLARVDVGATRDDQFLGAIAQRQKTVAVDRADVAGVQPAAAQRRGARFGVAPIPAHHAVAAHQDLADLARGERPIVLVRDHDLDHRLRRADRGEALRVAGVRDIGMRPLVQGGKAHRALALAVDLGEAIAEHVVGAIEIGEVHRTAAVDDGLEPKMIGARRARMLGQALHHGRRREHGDTLVLPEQLEDLGLVEAAACRNHLAGRLGRMGQDVQAGTV